MRGITLTGLAGITMLVASPAAAQQLTIPAGGVSNPNRVISIYNAVSNGQRIGQVTSDLNGYFEMIISYPATNDPDEVLIYTAYDTGGANIASFGITQANTPPTDFSTGVPGKRGYMAGMSYTGPGGVFKIKGRAIAFPNGTYALYSCLPWLGNGTYCDPNASVGWFNPGNLTELPKPPKTRASVDTDVNGAGTVVPLPITPLSNAPKPRNQVAAENEEKAPKPRMTVDNGIIIQLPPPKSHECANVKVIALKGSGANVTQNTPFSCSFSIPNVPLGQYAVRAEITEKNSSSVLFSAGGTIIFTIGTGGMMNGKVTYSTAAQEWILTQTP